LFRADPDLSDEHVIARWLRKELQIRGRVEEHREFGAPRELDTLAIVLPEVCVRCNTGWMSKIETRTSPILAPDAVW
jgi:hypothetical protein